MIGVIDPAFLLSRSSTEVEQEIDAVIRICRASQLIIEPLEEYWPKMWADLGRNLEKNMHHTGKLALQQLRRLGARSQVNLPLVSEVQGRAWRRGFQQLFSAAVMGKSWEEEMAAAVIRVLCAGHEVVVLTRRMLNRNVRLHAVSHSLIEENTRWVLHVSPQSIGHKQVMCVYNSRNLIAPWTTRFDFRLPSDASGCPYPFCPPDFWWKASVSAVRTTQSKPAWRDKHENGWARPNIPQGAGYHWDVYLSNKCAELVGVDQINVVEFGSDEGLPGHIHHIPRQKSGHITTTGWDCSTY